MTDNEKAAIAAGLWKPFSTSTWGETRNEHGNAAPDMHDPANLWRALERMQSRGWLVNFGVDPKDCSIHVAYADVNKGFQFYRKSDLFAALVALYDAERP